MDETNEFSFVLRPSTIEDAGVGVFAVHNIHQGAAMDALFPDGFISIARKASDLSKLFQGYSIARENDMYDTPRNFNRMEIGWYVNHSSNPNIKHNGKFYVATRDIKANEEILVNYNDLGEPDDKKQDYYRIK